MFRLAIMVCRVSLRALAAIAVTVTASTAAAWYQGVAPTADGGAWITADGYAIRIDPDGTHHNIEVPVGRTLGALAASGDTVWALGRAGLALRVGGQPWRLVSLPPANARDGEYVAYRGTLTPLGGERILAMRRCYVGGWTHCTHAFVVDGDRVTASNVFNWEIGEPTADGRGGAWAPARHGKHLRGYVRFDGTTWTSWTDREIPIQGMQSAGASAANPTHVVVAADNALIGLDADRLLWIASTGVVTHRTAVVGDAARDEVLCTIPDRSEISIVFGARSDQVRTPAPLVVRVDARTGARLGSGEIEPPMWWERRHHDGTAPLRCGAAGGTAWIVSRDAVFRRVGDGDWETAAEHDVSDDELAVTRQVWSLPFAIGGDVDDADTQLALGIRPEVIVVPNRLHPRYGLGAYAELSRADGGTVAGAGLTAALYGRRFGTALSVGFAGRFEQGDAHRQLVFSAFVGRRAPSEIEFLDTPFGLRVDVRPGTSDVPATVSVMASIDLFTVMLMGVAFGAVI